MNASIAPAFADKTVPFSLDEVDGNIVERFRKVASALGDNLALKSGDHALTFRELEERSNALAHAIGESPGAGDSPVALMFKHGNGSIIAQLAVLKLGRFYCCLDADLRAERQNTILSQLGSVYLLCDAASLEPARELRLAFPDITILNVDEIEQEFAVDSPPAKAACPDDIAYIVTTSGSTGTPKGVMLSHRNVLATAYAHGHDFQIDSTDKSFHVCPHSTASAGSEIFTALLNGSALFPFSIKDSGIRRFQELIVEERMTTFTASPILFRLIFKTFSYHRRFPSIRLIRLGGDRITRMDVDILRERFDHSCRLRVGYGASEYMPAMQLFIDSGDDVDNVLPLGYPVQGCTISLIDDEGTPVPAGTPGEIVIASQHLSLGYWKDAERTARSFGWAQGNLIRTYRTNDVAYQDADGCFHFIGRKDSIVKINGKQVCVADVQRVLLAVSWIKDAAVVPITGSQNGVELVAFVVTSDESLKISRLRASLASDLPYEAMPTKLLRLNEIPLTPNNKTDLQALKRLAEAMIGSKQRNEPADIPPPGGTGGLPLY